MKYRDPNERLNLLAAEAMDRGTSYGKLIASITPVERERIIDHQREKRARRRRAEAARRRTKHGEKEKSD